MDELFRIDRLSKVIEHAIAPAFILGSIAAFLAIMLARIENLVTRLRQMKPEHGDRRKLRQRIVLLNRAVTFALASAICASTLVMASFIFGFLNLTHIYGTALLFLLSTTLLSIALGLFVKEIRLSIKEYETLE
jgi:Protein of unknown function (DUF2721)